MEENEGNRVSVNSKRQFSVRHVLWLIFATSVLLALVVQVRHVGFVAFCFAAALVIGLWTRNRRLVASSLTALLVFVATYLACWLDMGYMHRMGSPHPYRLEEVRRIQHALTEYAKQNGAYPESLAELEVASRPWDPLCDWWNHPFRYKRTANDYELSSLGRDGKTGGVGLDSDIVIDKELKNVYVVRLTLSQFAFETAGSIHVFWSACIARSHA